MLVNVAFCNYLSHHISLSLSLPLQQFGKELLADEKNEVKYDKVLKILETASGAAYGTGK